MILHPPLSLWDVMLSLNTVFLNKFSRDSMLRAWFQLYFIGWWLVAAIMGMNLFVSLVLDIFLIGWAGGSAQGTTARR